MAVRVNPTSALPEGRKDRRCRWHDQFRGVAVAHIQNVASGPVVFAVWSTRQRSSTRSIATSYPWQTGPGDRRQALSAQDPPLMQLALVVTITRWGGGGARQGDHRCQTDQVCDLLDLAKEEPIAQEEFKGA